MSFLKKLFGLGGAAAPADEPVAETRDYKGYVIAAAPLREGAQWRLAGSVSRETDKGRQEHRFIRADVFADRADAIRFAFMKGERLVDELGENVFL